MGISVYVAGVMVTSPDVVVVITDHFGNSRQGDGSACTLSEAEQELSGSTWVTPTRMWRVEIGQCPSFTQAYIAQSSKTPLVGGRVRL